MRIAGIVLAFFGSAIVALIVTVVLSGISQSGVVNMQMTHVLFWIAFGISSVAVTLGTYLISKSLKYSLLALVGTAVLVGGGLWWLNSWLAVQKAEQEATDHIPKPIYTNPPGPSIPITKTPRAKNPQVNIQQHGTGNGAVGGNVTVAPCSNSSIGGVNVQQTVNCGSKPCPWKALTEPDYKRIAVSLSSAPARIYIAIIPNNADATRFAGFIAAGLHYIAHWNTDDFESAYVSWGNRPGITVVVRDIATLDDKESAAAKLKAALESHGLAVHTQEQPGLAMQDDLALWVGTCD